MQPATTTKTQISTLISPATYKEGVVFPQLKPVQNMLENVFVIFVNTTTPALKTKKHKQSKKQKKDDIFKSLRGSLKHIKEFQGKTSVEVQHYITNNLW